MSSLTIAFLVSALKAAHADDGAAQRAADKAAAHLSQTPAPVMAFDGTELRVLSQSRGRDGTHHVADAASCTCEGSRHPWCLHRAEYRLKLAELALTDPAALLRTLAEQLAPAERAPATVAPAPQIAAVIAGLAAPDDDADYLDAIVALAERDEAAARVGRVA